MAYYSEKRRMLSGLVEGFINWIENNDKDLKVSSSTSFSWFGQIKST